MLGWLRILLVWLLALVREWGWTAVSAVFAALGIAPKMVIGDDLPAIVDTWEARLVFAVIAIGVLIAMIYHKYESRSVHNKELRQAIEDLGSDNLHLRMNAITTLGGLSRKSRTFHYRAINALATFLRTNFPAPEESGRSITIKKEKFKMPGVSVQENWSEEQDRFVGHELSVERRELADDGKAAIEAIANRRKGFDYPQMWIDLSLVDLPSVNLEEANLGQVSFAGANLRYARFDGANLREACFSGSILTEARFDHADLRDADFSSCRGHRIYLENTKLRDAKFFASDIFDAHIQNADARNVNFMSANIWRLDAGKTNFTGANFANANIRGASLHHAVGLSRTQIYGNRVAGFAAIYDKNTRLPWSTEEELREAGVIRVGGGSSNQSHQGGRRWPQWLRGIARKRRP